MKHYGIRLQAGGPQDGAPDLPAIAAAVRDQAVKLVFIQRSRGYTVRKTLSCEEIGEICPDGACRRLEAAIMVDNCYGGFVEETEPTRGWRGSDCRVR